MNKEERRYVANLVRTFGADVLLNMEEMPRYKTAERARRRKQVTEVVNSCALCPLGSGCEQHVPAEWPGQRYSLPSAFAVIGEAPGPDEDRRGRPFIGRAGQLLRSAISTAGFHPDDVTYINAVSCFPHETERGLKGQERKVIRQPSEDEMLRCYRNYREQLDAADCRYVVLLGSVALKLWRKDLRVTQMQGKMGVMHGRWYVWTMLHPAAVLRGVIGQSDWQRQMSEFVEVVREGRGSEMLGTECLMKGECGEGRWMWDMDGLPWCEGHWQQGIDGHERTVKWWSREVAKRNQAALL